MPPDPASIPRHIPRQATLLSDLVQAVDHAVNHGRPADETLQKLFRRHREFGSRDRRLFSSVVFSWLRWKGWLDAFEHDNPWPARVVLAHALDAVDQLDPAAAYLAASCGMDATELVPAGPLSLAEKADTLADWLDGTDAPDPWNLLPDWIPDLLVPALREPEHDSRMLSAFQARPPTWLRLRGAAPEIVLAALQAEGLPVEAHPTFPGAASLPGSTRLPSGKLANRFYVQDLASQVVGRICAPEPGQHWWDACAGSGGKSFLLADLMQGRGQVDATDVRPGAIDAFRERLKSMNVQRLRAQVRDAGLPPAKRVPYDGALVDAPCTGMGTWARNPDARWRIRPEMVERKAAQQLRLLEGAANELKPDGVLVYAVCTLTAAETTGVHRTFLERRTDFVDDPFPHPLDPDREASAEAWILPGDHACNGMYMARFRKAT